MFVTLYSERKLIRHLFILLFVNILLGLFRCFVTSSTGSLNIVKGFLKATMSEDRFS